MSLLSFSLPYFGWGGGPFSSWVFLFFFFSHACIFNNVWFQKLVLKHFSPQRLKSKMKAISLLGSFPGVTLSWNESRSLCSLFVSMCYVHGAPLRPHLPSHIQMTPWSELLAAFPLLLLHPHFVGD